MWSVEKDEDFVGTHVAETFSGEILEVTRVLKPLYFGAQFFLLLHQSGIFVLQGAGKRFQSDQVEDAVAAEQGQEAEAGDDEKDAADENPF